MILQSVNNLTKHFGPEPVLKGVRFEVRAGEKISLIGPNGTGKSSFCEALEFGLLGNVAEAESKRFRNQDDYLKNAHTNSFEAPVIVGID